MKVMTRLNKTLVLHWATAAQNNTVTRRNNLIEQDITEYTWTDTVVKELTDIYANDPTRDLWNAVYNWAQHNADNG